jgi:hypothetical protein
VPPPRRRPAVAARAGGFAGETSAGRVTMGGGGRPMGADRSGAAGDT